MSLIFDPAREVWKLLDKYTILHLLDNLGQLVAVCYVFPKKRQFVRVFLGI